MGDTDPSFEKRAVTRKIDPTKKKRKRYDSDDELDDFIVDDDSDDDIRAPDTDDLSQTLPPPSQFDHLTNLILLTGPAGTGKTSSVYAVAEELGFEVFEVSPGQKRSFKDLLTAVGGVGSNHLVWASGKAGPMGSVSSPKGKKPSASFFGSKDAKSKGKVKEDGKANGLDGFFSGKASSKGKGKAKEDQQDEAAETAPAKEVSQSLILLEEVDILFQDDKSYVSFWDGVVQIVANSMRPVILTCNGKSSAPSDESD